MTQILDMRNECFVLVLDKVDIGRLILAASMFVESEGKSREERIDRYELAKLLERMRTSWKQRDKFENWPEDWKGA